MHMLVHVAPAYGQFRLAHIGLAFARLARRHRAKAQHRCRIDETAMLAATVGDNASLEQMKCNDRVTSLVECDG